MSWHSSRLPLSCRATPRWSRIAAVSLVPLLWMLAYVRAPVERGVRRRAAGRARSRCRGYADAWTQLNMLHHFLNSVVITFASVVGDRGARHAGRLQLRQAPVPGQAADLRRAPEHADAARDGDHRAAVPAVKALAAGRHGAGTGAGLRRHVTAVRDAADAGVLRDAARRIPGATRRASMGRGSSRSSGASCCRSRRRAWPP